jgi:anti-sigma B factor antagonist
MFGVEIDREDDRCLLTLRGQMDLSTASQFNEALSAVCADGAREILIDLHELDFMDTTGLASILGGRALCAEHDCQYFIRTPVPPAHERLLSITGVRHRLAFKRRARPQAGPA